MQTVIIATDPPATISPPTTIARTIYIPSPPPANNSVRYIVTGIVVAVFVALLVALALWVRCRRASRNDVEYESNSIAKHSQRKQTSDAASIPMQPTESPSESLPTSYSDAKQLAQWEEEVQSHVPVRSKRALEVSNTAYDAVEPNEDVYSFQQANLDASGASNLTYSAPAEDSTEDKPLW